MEVELKFAITGALDPDRITALDLAPYTISDTGIELHNDVLLDTASRAITSGHHALRIRTIGDERTLTLKGPNRGAGATYEREEWEMSLPGPLSYDPRDWPPEIGQQALGLAQGEPLGVLLRVRVERRLWAVHRGGRIIGELALDSGEVIAAGRREPLHELELELKGAGKRADLDALREALQRLAPLTPESRSKLERGLALLRRARWACDGYTSLASLVRHVVRRRLRDLLTAQSDVLEHSDPDAIHDMRVASRRLRTTFQACEGAGAFADGELRSLRKRLGAVAADLGDIRDKDIFLQRVQDWAGEDKELRRNLAPLRSLLEAQRATGDDRLRDRLDSHKHTRLIADLEQLAHFEERGWLEDQDCVLVRHVVGSVIWPRYERVLRYDAAVFEADPMALHQLRIACKRMRYALELLATPLGAGVAPARKALVAAQSLLGDIQDLTVALRLVEQLSADDPENAGLRAFERSLTDERASLMRQVDGVWAALRSQQLREALSRSIASL